jgi:hypothetical protein
MENELLEVVSHVWLVVGTTSVFQQGIDACVHEIVDNCERIVHILRILGVSNIDIS